MPTDVIWRSIAWPGLEHAIWADDDYMRADSESVYVLPEGSVRVEYVIHADSHGRTRHVTVNAETSTSTHKITLKADADGTWHDDRGPRPDLDGCIDVDISTSPLTNTLPIRRLGLEPGKSADLQVVYIDVPDLKVSPAQQQYTALWVQESRAGYRYESGDFPADLTVDHQGLVVDYPELWIRRSTAMAWSESSRK